MTTSHIMEGGEVMRSYERAGMMDSESRSLAIERAKKGKASYEKRQALLRQIGQALKLSK